MKKYIYVFSIFSLIGSFADVVAVAELGKTAEAGVVFIVLGANGVDTKVVCRGWDHARYYSTKRTQDFFSKENAIDYVVYPIVDTVVGQGMTKLNSIESIHALTNSISKDNRDFIADNVQLATSAAIIKGIRLSETKGISNINHNDAKNFGKDCAVQVGCKAVGAYIVEPAVRSLVEDQNSWTAWGLRVVGYYVLSQIVVDNVSKI